MTNITPRPENFQGSDSTESGQDNAAKVLAEALSEAAYRLAAERPTISREEFYRAALDAALDRTNLLVVSRLGPLPAQKPRLTADERYQLRMAPIERLRRDAELALAKIQL